LPFRPAKKASRSILFLTKLVFGDFLCCCRQNRRERFWTCEAWPVGWITWT